jgi:hypothetical protein
MQESKIENTWANKFAKAELGLASLNPRNSMIVVIERPQLLKEDLEIVAALSDKIGKEEAIEFAMKERFKKDFLEKVVEHNPFDLEATLEQKDLLVEFLDVPQRPSDKNFKIAIKWQLPWHCIKEKGNEDDPSIFVDEHCGFKMSDAIYLKKQMSMIVREVGGYCERTAHLSHGDLS